MSVNPVDLTPFDGVTNDYRPQDYQKALLRDEAILKWAARNRIKEALVAKITEMISKEKDPTALLDALDRLENPDAFTQKILNTLV